ncbi:Rft-1-domain-containing protein [Lactarius sanguifluus]|nr:Rft-1-domain-containing protein [Lactarius sanguifluus]
MNFAMKLTSLTSVSSLVFLQLFSRIFTFVLNQALMRLAAPQTFGTVTVQFELLLSITVFLSREGVRTALLRQRKTVPPDLARNIALLPAYVGTPIAVALAVLYSATSASAVRAQQHFHLSVSIYAFAAALELATEPLYICAQNELRVDGAAVFSKTLATFLGLAFAPPARALAAYALATFAVFWNFGGWSTRYVLRRVTLGDHGHKKGAYFDQELLHLSGAMTAQSVVKYFLTEGDKLLIYRFSPLADQGGYAIASNYGSLVARVLFRPIEETSRTFFSKSLSSFPSSSPPSNCCQPSSSHQQTSAPRILRAFRFYLPAMAYNGVLEAFLASSRMVAAASAALIATALAGARVIGAGDAALVWANTASMAVCALYAWRFARRFCKARAVPHRQRETERALGLAALPPPRSACS